MDMKFLSAGAEKTLITYILTKFGWSLNVFASHNVTVTSFDVSCEHHV